MKNLLLFGGMALSLNALSQTTIFQDNFENGSSNWQLNGGTGNNNWIVNNVYTGFTGFIDDTPAQPSSFTGGSNSTYLHITNTQICGAGVCNANFDTGSTSDQKATMANAVSTTGMTGVSFSFWYISDGAATTSFGTVEYTADGGTTWTALGAQLNGVTTWTQLNLTDAGLDNKAALKFRFRWQNGAAGEDPAYSVDEVKLTGTTSGAASIATSAVTPLSACFNTAQAVSVPFNATGTYTSGNIFTAQLSNATGSFSSPVSIGTLASTSSGNLTINATIPAGTSVGSGYRVRVVSSVPAATGTDNGSNITVHTLPLITIIPANGTITPGQSITLTASGGTSYTWSPAATLSSTTGTAVDAHPSVTTTYAVIATDINGCMGTSTSVITVTSNAGIATLAEGEKLYLYPNPATESFEVVHSFNQPIEKLVIRDNNGRKVRTYDKPKPEKFFIADLNSGIYSVGVTISGNTYLTKLVIP